MLILATPLTQSVLLSLDPMGLEAVYIDERKRL